MSTVLSAVLLLAALTPTAWAQSSPIRINLARLGPQVGAVAPDFKLQDSQGKTWTRASIMGPNGALLVFSRSLDWCPSCKTQLLDLQARSAELKTKGLGLAVITYDAPEVLRDFARRRRITIPLLTDPESGTIKNYGILNTTVDETSTNVGIPFPGTFVLNRQGVVTARFFEEAYQRRTTVSSILIARGATGRPATATRATTDHLDMVSSLSDEIVAPGSVFSIVLDIQPRAQIHVYAPGAKGYKIIAFNLEPNRLLVTRPTAYPKSDLYFFEPLKERVPVYQRPFRLTRSMSITTAAGHRATVSRLKTLTVKGTLDYQACDDRVCFTPRSIPVSFDVRVRPLDTDRAP